MRDLDKEELGSVYGAGDWRCSCRPPKKHKRGKGGGKGGSSSDRDSKSKKSGKGGSSS